MLLFCCSNSVKQNNPTIESIISKENNNLYGVEKEILHKDYAMKIITITQNDSVIPEEKNYFNPIVISQTFKFYRNKTILNSFSLPIKTIGQKVYGGKVEKMLDCVIFNIKLIERENADIVYHVVGYGGCNGGCPTCNVIFSLTGEILAIEYRTEIEIIKREGNPIYLNEFVNGVIAGNLLKELTFYPEKNPKW